MVNPMKESILYSVMRNCGYEDQSDYEQAFLTEINSVLASLYTRCGVLTSPVVLSDGTTTWEAITTNPELVTLISYVSMKTKLKFDIETISSPVKTAMDAELSEMEFSLMTAVGSFI